MNSNVEEWTAALADARSELQSLEDRTNEAAGSLSRADAQIVREKLADLRARTDALEARASARKAREPGR